jgi:hypothetical protein
MSRQDKCIRCAIINSSTVAEYTVETTVVTEKLK